jgi:hypothetical protein
VQAARRDLGGAEVDMVARVNSASCDSSVTVCPRRPAAPDGWPPSPHHVGAGRHSTCVALAASRAPTSEITRLVPARPPSLIGGALLSAATRPTVGREGILCSAGGDDADGDVAQPAHPHCLPLARPPLPAAQVRARWGRSRPAG